MGRRRFAKNPNDVRHFRLVSRSARDPKIIDPDATPNVLEPFVPVNLERRRPDIAEHKMTMPDTFAGLDDVLGFEARGAEPFDQSTIRRPNDEEDTLSDLAEEEDQAAIEARLAQLDGDCYFPRDGYNYDQHMKRVSTSAGKSSQEATTVVLAKPGLESAKPAKGKVEAFSLKEDEDLLAPVITEDMPDPEDLGQEELAAMRALEFDDEYEEVDDILLEELLPSGVAVKEKELLWGSTAVEDDHLPDLELLRKMHAQCFIGAGPSDADPENAAQLDQVLDEEYGDEHIGDMEDEEIEGTMNVEDLEDILDEYIQDKAEEQAVFKAIQEPHMLGEPMRKGDIVDDEIRVTAETRALIEQFHTYVDDEETESGESSEDESKNWDCESVLSTLSNVSNRPGKIGKIKVVKKPKSAKPAVVQECPDAEAKAEAGEESSEDDVVELPDVCNERKKDETPEEKRARKAGVKAARRICRTMKKESKQLYKQEELKMAKASTYDVRSKVRIQKL